MNAAINELRDEHQSQLSQMKLFYDGQLQQIRQEYTAAGTPQPIVDSQ